MSATRDARPPAGWLEGIRLIALSAALGIVGLLPLPGTARASSTPPSFGPPALIDARAPFPPGPTGILNIACATPTSCVATGGKLAQRTTDAGGSAAPHWSEPQVITQGSVNQVSCPTSSLCVAVVSDGTAVSSSDGGVTWSRPVGVETGANLNAISCVSSGVCLASAINHLGDGSLYVSSDSGQTWSGPDNPPSAFGAVSCLPTGECVAIGEGGGAVFVSKDVGVAGTPTWTTSSVDSGPGFLTALSCTANAVCVAVDSAGYALVSDDVSAPNALWSRLLIDGTGDIGSGLVGLVSVSCAQTSTNTTPDLCVAGDFLGRTAISTTVAGSTPSSWSIVPTFDTGNIESAGGNGDLLTPITCVSTAWCAAADTTGEVTYAVVPLANPGATQWSTPPVTLAGADQMSAVSCAASGLLCTALDTTGHAVSSSDGGATWSAPVTVDAAAGGSLAGVSCVSGGQCVAVGNTFTTLGNTGIPRGEALVSTPSAAGAAWLSTPIDVDGTFEGVPTGPALDGVSCVDTGLCVVVDTQGNSVISPDLGGSWVVVATGDTAPLSSVSCPTSALCVATDRLGRVVTSVNAASDDPSWSAPLTVDGPGGGSASVALTSVSCTTRGLCAAVDEKGRAVISTNAGATWSKPAVIAGPPATPLVSVSCAVSGLCVTVDGAGNAFYSINPGSASPTWTLSSSNSRDLTAVSCVGTGLCIGVDAVGDAVLSISQVASAKLGGASRAFPDTVLGSVSPAQTVTVTNGGGAPLNVSAVSLGGGDAGQFALSSNHCDGAFVPPGASCSVAVAFAPASTGVFTAADLVVTSDSGSSPDQVWLSGTGVLGPVLSLSGGPAAFADTALGALSATATFTATNRGQSPLHVAVAVLSGADAGQFRLIGGNCAGVTLAPGSSCGVGVAFAPTSPGPHAARLELDSDAQPAQAAVALNGNTAAVNPQSAFSIVSVKAARKGSISVKVKLPQAGRLLLSTRSNVTGTRRKGSKPTRAKQITYGREVAATVKGPTTATATITPGKAGRAALSLKKKLRVVVSASFSPPGGKRRALSVAVTVTAK